MMQKNIHKKIIYCTSLVVLFVFAYFMGIHFLLPTPAPVKFHINGKPQPILIAHAGGTIHGYNYTNSLEALEQAAQNGYMFVELDILESCDGYLVAVHDWKSFHEMTGDTSKSTECIDKKDFLKRKMINKFTPISAEEISHFFSEHKNMFLVTDKIKDFAAIREQLNIPTDNLLVETFSYDNYKSALRQGIKYPMLCIWTKESLKKHWDKLTSGKINMITIPTKLIPLAEQELKSLHAQGVTIFAFTENNAQNIAKYAGTHVSGYYTDTIKH